MSEEWTVELVSVYKYPASSIDAIGSPGYDSGWVGSGDVQYRTIISSTITSPCEKDCPPSSI